MAEEKKGSTSILDSHDPYEVIVFLLLISGLGYFLIERILSFRHSDLTFTEAAKAYFIGILPYVTIISITISGLFIVGIIRSLLQLKKIYPALQVKFHSVPSHGDDHSVPKEIVNKRWEKVLEYIKSPNMNDWKLAILEADVMLEEMVNAIGYPGESLGEKLKNVERSDFITVDKAWEAHKIRNAIAHEGTNFLLNYREATRVVSLFEEVFKEFRYI